jgi:hypothetical protein
LPPRLPPRPRAWTSPSRPPACCSSPVVCTTSTCATAEKRDALVAEGHAAAARIVAEAEAKQREQAAILNEQKAGIEKKIDELRVFEREYRQKLRGYIESQLHELDQNAGPSGAKVGADASKA